MVGVLCRTRQEAQDVPAGDIQLSLCKNCSYVGNRVYDPQKIYYSPGYDVSQHHSLVFQQFITDLASSLVTRYNLADKTVLEIGCGQGNFLRALCRAGGKSGIGIDPVLTRQTIEECNARSITFIRDEFSERYASFRSDFICCRHVLQVLPHPREFLGAVRRVIGDRYDSIVYFEVQNGSDIFRKNIPWGLQYECCSLYTQESLVYLFQSCGFNVLRVGPCFADDQYLSIEAAPARSNSTGEMVRNGGRTASEAFAFAQSFRLKVEHWREQLEEIADSGRRAVAWGSGGRGIGFLSITKTRNSLPFVVDINPERQGSYVPGTAQLVVAPHFLLGYKPDVIIVTNPAYMAEVDQQVKDMGLDCELMAA
jgi:SAM-dependent methyltransferase